MSQVALIAPSAQGPFAEPVRGGFSHSSGTVLVLATAMVVLLLAIEVLIVVARALLEPILALIGTLFRLLFVLGVAVAIILMLVSSSAHGAGPADGGVDRPPAGTLP